MFIVVYLHAQKLAIQQPSLDAQYVKRSQLRQYLPSSILKLERPSSKRTEQQQPQHPQSTGVPTTSTTSNDETTASTTTDETKTSHHQVHLLKNESKDSFVMIGENSGDGASTNKPAATVENLLLSSSASASNLNNDSKLIRIRCCSFFVTLNVEEFLFSRHLLII